MFVYVWRSGPSTCSVVGQENSNGACILWVVEDDDAGTPLVVDYDLLKKNGLRTVVVAGLRYVAEDDKRILCLYSLGR